MDIDICNMCTKLISSNIIGYSKICY